MCFWLVSCRAADDSEKRQKRPAFGFVFGSESGALLSLCSLHVLPPLGAAAQRRSNRWMQCSHSERLFGAVFTGDPDEHAQRWGLGLLVEMVLGSPPELLKDLAHTLHDGLAA